MHGSHAAHDELLCMCSSGTNPFEVLHCERVVRAAVRMELSKYFLIVGVGAALVVICYVTFPCICPCIKLFLERKSELHDTRQDWQQHFVHSVRDNSAFCQKFLDLLGSRVYSLE